MHSKINDINRRSLSSYVTLSLIFLSIVPMLLSTMLSIYGAWMGANEGGKGWTGNSVNHLQFLMQKNFEDLVTEIEEITALPSVDEKTIQLENHSFVFSKDGQVVWASQDLQNFVGKSSLFSLSCKRELSSVLLSKIDIALCFKGLVKHRSEQGEITLFHKLSGDFLKTATALTGTEISVHDADGKMLSGTWKTDDDKPLRISVEKNVAILAKQNSNKPRLGKARVTILGDNYAGLEQVRHEGPPHEKGAKLFDAFYAIVPIFSALGSQEPIGYFFSVAPASTLMFGAWKGIYAALGTFFFLIIAIAMAGTVIKNNFIRPIRIMASCLDNVADAFEAKAGVENVFTRVQKDLDTKLPKNSQVAELVLLEKTVRNLNRSMHSYTEFKSHEESMKEKLVHASRLATLGEMAGGIAHEINTPLNVISLRSDQLRRANTRGQLTAELVEKTCHTISSTVEKIDGIVQALRHFSRTGEKDPFLDTDVKQIIDESIEMVSPFLERHQIEIKTSEYDESLQVKCRKMQIVQVLLNLISNSKYAIKELPERWICIEVLADEQFVTFKVSDSGKGIDKQVQEKLMNPFFTTKELGEGTGLGLSISRGIIEDHGGKLWLDSEAPHTTFVFNLKKA